MLHTKHASKLLNRPTGSEDQLFFFRTNQILNVRSVWSVWLTEKLEPTTGEGICIHFCGGHSLRLRSDVRTGHAISLQTDTAVGNLHRFEVFVTPR